MKHTCGLSGHECSLMLPPAVPAEVLHAPDMAVRIHSKGGMVQRVMSEKTFASSVGQIVNSQIDQSDKGVR